VIHGLFLDPRTWAIDYKTSPFWRPERYGVKIDLHDNDSIPNIGVDDKYKFVIATEVWELPMQKTLEYLRSKGLKVILVPREIAPTKSHAAVMFNNFEKFRYKDQCYFTPDIVLAAGRQYAELWKGLVPAKAIGYPRFDVYLGKTKKTKSQMLKRYKAEQDKKIIFFPAYPPYHLQTVDGKSVSVSLYEDLQNTLRALEQYALSHPEVQVISKVHPMSFKCYRKRMGSKKELAGLLLKYYKKPTKYMRVIGDLRNDSSIAREMILMADVVVGYTSMMLLESLVVGKPTLHLKFKQARTLKDTLEFSNGITTIYEPEELAPALDNMGDKLLDNNMALVEKYLHRVDGKFCERLCEEIKEIVDG